MRETKPLPCCLTYPIPETRLCTQWRPAASHAIATPVTRQCTSYISNPSPGPAVHRYRDISGYDTRHASAIPIITRRWQQGVADPRPCRRGHADGHDECIGRSTGNTHVSG